MTRKILTLIMAVAVMGLSLSSCKKFADEKRNSKTTTSGSALLACDESFQKIMEQEIDVFEYQYPEASILSYWLPESQVVDSLLSGGNIRIAVLSRQLTPTEERVLKSQKRVARCERIAVDAIAIIANPANPVEEISVSDLEKILTGEISEWKWVQPGNNTGEISVIFDYSGSSTVKYMQDSIMGGKDFGKNIYAQNSNAKVFDAVSKTKGAIGIIGVSWISSDLKTANMTTEEISADLESDDAHDIAFSESVKVLAVAGRDQVVGKKPYQQYIYDGLYPLVRSIYMVNTAYSGTPSAGFFSFVTGPLGQKLMLRTGILPGRVAPRVVEVE